jgi:hypothetical protein
VDCSEPVVIPPSGAAAEALRLPSEDVRAALQAGPIPRSSVLVSVISVIPTVHPTPRRRGASPSRRGGAAAGAGSAPAPAVAVVSRPSGLGSSDGKVASVQLVFAAHREYLLRRLVVAKRDKSKAAAHVSLAFYHDGVVDFAELFEICHEPVVIRVGRQLSDVDPSAAQERRVCRPTWVL